MEVRSSTWSVRRAWAVVARQAALRTSPAGQPLVPHPTHLEGYIVQGLKSSKEARQVLVGRLGPACESEFATRRSPTEKTTFTVSPTGLVSSHWTRLWQLSIATRSRPPEKEMVWSQAAPVRSLKRACNRTMYGNSSSSSCCVGVNHRATEHRRDSSG
jgi:hypothetical protein